MPSFTAPQGEVSAGRPPIETTPATDCCSRWSVKQANPIENPPDSDRNSLWRLHRQLASPHVPKATGENAVPTLRQYEYLVAVADTRHFGRAAERVHITQPTLSEQLRALEQRLGVQLVERSRSSVVVTPLGFEVVEIARRMLRDGQRISDLTRTIGTGMGGVVRLGLPSTIGPYLLPRVVPHIHALYPQLKLYAREELPSVLPQGLAEGLHDVIVAPLPVAQTGFEEAVLFDEPLYLAVPLDHELAQRDSIKAHDLAGFDLLALGPGYQLRDIVVNLAAEVGANIRFDYEGTSLDTLREMMATGLGISVLPGLYVRSVLHNDPRFKTFEIGRRGLKRTFGMLWRKTKSSQPNFERLASLFRETVEHEFTKPRAEAMVD